MSLRLADKLNAWRWLLWPLFPRGFGFASATASRCMRRGAAGCATRTGKAGDCEIPRAGADGQGGAANNHLSDLGITMFVRVRLLRRLDPRRIYGLFVLFQFDDYGHLRGPRAFARWLRAILRDLWPPRYCPSRRTVRTAAPGGGGADNRARR